MTLPADRSTPNYVSSQAADPDRRVRPLDAGVDGIERLARLIERTPRASIVSQTETSLQAVFVTPVLRFRDDLHAEAAIVDGRSVLHIHSASRIGYGDLGKNRRRVEWLRQQLTDDGT